MTTPEEREAACARFLEDTRTAYVRAVEDAGRIRYVLFDETGDPLIMGDLLTCGLVAENRGMTLCTVQ